MNIPEIKNALKHLQKTCKCPNCKTCYIDEHINVVATTQNEGLFDMRCESCKLTTLVTVVLTPKNQKQEITEKIVGGNRTHRGISQNDVLDVKNFLKNFDGNFKEFFEK